MAKRIVGKRVVDRDAKRTDGRFVSTAGFVEQLMRKPPALAFSADIGAKGLPAWRARVRRKLRELLAFPRVGPQPAPRLLSEVQRDGYRVQNWELYPEPFSAVPVLLLVPDGASRLSHAPAVLCIPGTDHPKEWLAGEPWTGHGENKWGDREQMAKQFAKAGFVALAMDNPCTAELFDPNRPDWKRQSDNLIWLGRSYPGLTVFQKLAALKWLKTLPYVDRRRIATCGHSLGAEPALMAAILDEDVAAVVWNGAAASLREHTIATGMTPTAPWHYTPGFALWFDFLDLMCAMAPRPLLATEGGPLKDHALIRKAYSQAGAKGNVKITFMPNFADPVSRYRGPLPVGIDNKAYARYANIDGDHYFKGEVAVPWLCKLFGVKGGK